MDEVQFLKLDSGYIEEMLEIQRICWETEPGIFVASSQDAYLRAFEYDNFVVGVSDGGRLVGFLNCAAHNRHSGMNLGKHLGYSPEMLDRVGHLNTVLMRPDHRGHGLALRLVEMAIREFPPRVRYLMATTAPWNTAAQRILNDFGFARQGGEIEVSGQRRLLFVRDLELRPK